MGILYSVLSWKANKGLLTYFTLVLQGQKNFQKKKKYKEWAENKVLNY
jgi:hypothetical protein